MSRDRVPLGQLVIGSMVLFIGLLWTLDSLGIMDTGDLVRWWPLGLLTYGAFKLVGFGTRKNPVAGIVFIVGATALLLNMTGAIDVSLRLFWPTMIFSLGAILVIRALGGLGGPLGKIGEFGGSSAFMGGVTHRVAVDSFTGGAANAMLGAVEYDLTGVTKVEPDAILDIFAFWGGIDVIVPAGWRVENRVTALLGGVHDSRPPSAVTAASQTLVVRGLVMMGGLEIKGEGSPRRGSRMSA